MGTDTHFCENPRCPYHSVMVPVGASGSTFASLPKLDLNAMLTNEPRTFEHKWVKRISWYIADGEYQCFCENCAKAVSMGCSSWVKSVDRILHNTLDMDNNFRADWILNCVENLLAKQEKAIDDVTERVTNQLTRENWQKITFLQDALKQMREGR